MTQRSLTRRKVATGESWEFTNVRIEEVRYVPTHNLSGPLEWRQVKIRGQWITVDESFVGEPQVDLAPQPPMLAEMITRFVTKPKLVDRIIGDRAEQFARYVESRGTFRAHVFYWSDTLRTCWPQIKVLGRWLLAGEFLRRFLGS